MNKTCALVLWEESIVCMIVIADDLSDEVFGIHVDACIRGWVLRDRKNNELYIKWRIKYPDGKRSWHILPVEPPHDEAKEQQMRCSLEDTFRIASKRLGFGDPHIEVFYPPKNLTPEQTLQWLVDEDLVEVTYMGPETGAA